MVAVEIREFFAAYTAGHLDIVSIDNIGLQSTLHTVGMWLTYGSCTIVPIVFATERFPNSKSVCSSQIASRSKMGPFKCFLKKMRVRVCATAAELDRKS